MIRKFVFFLSFLLLILGIVAQTAEAARFGGGRSFGTQRSFSHFARQPQAPQMNSFNTQAPRRSWAAPLAGLAIGSLLGYMLMGHGLTSGLLTWVFLLGFLALVWSFIRSKLQISPQASPMGQGRVFEATSYFNKTNDYTSSSAQATSPYPAGFDSESFLREAKVQFIRLQAAFDAKDLKDLREFTAPEVFAEIQMQLQERGDKANHTEVVSLNADLLDVGIENHDQVATVKFSGVLREDKNAPSAFFEEAWHFKKDQQQKWIVAGVQQTVH